MGMRDKPGEIRAVPRRFRRRLLERKFPPCPFCGEIPKYPAHKNYCKKNPDAQANRERVRAKAREAYETHGIRERAAKGTERSRDRERARKSEWMKKRWADGKVKVNVVRGWNHTLEARLKLSQRAIERERRKAPKFLERAIDKANVVAPILDDDFFRKPKQTSEWEVVETWTNGDDFDPFS